MQPVTRDRHDTSNNPYFEYSSKGIEVIEDGLKELPFGEFLVERKAIDRFQLFTALQLQDRHPGSLLGECITQLGYLPEPEVTRLLAEWQGCDTVDL